MKLDHVIKVLFVVMILMLILTATLSYFVYNNLCNNEIEYSAVELIQSHDAYKVCGSNFGIVNTSDTQIEVTKYEATNDEVTSETLKQEATKGETVTLKSGATLKIDASDMVVYQIDNPLGSNLDQTIQVRKF